MVRLTHRSTTWNRELFLWRKRIHKWKSRAVEDYENLPCIIAQHLELSIPFLSLSLILCPFISLSLTVIVSSFYLSKIVPGIRPDSTSWLGGHGGEGFRSRYVLYFMLCFAFPIQEEYHHVASHLFWQSNEFSELKISGKSWVGRKATLTLLFSSVLFCSFSFFSFVLFLSCAGLVMAKEIITLHKGEVLFKSQVGVWNVVLGPSHQYYFHMYLASIIILGSIVTLSLWFLRVALFIFFNRGREFFWIYYSFRGGWQHYCLSQSSEPVCTSELQSFWSIEDQNNTAKSVHPDATTQE